jgi:hypothetical protein
MSRKKYVTTFDDADGNTSIGKVIIEGIEVIEEKIWNREVTTTVVCVIDKPAWVANSWSKLRVNSDIVELPRNLRHLPSGFVSSKTFAGIWKKLWDDGVYECHWPALKDEMFEFEDVCTWYAQGMDLMEYDPSTRKTKKNGKQLMNFDV